MKSSRFIGAFLAASLCTLQLISCQAVDQLLIGVSGVDGNLLPSGPQVAEVKNDIQQTSEEFSSPDRGKPTRPLIFPAEYAVPFSARHDTYLQRWNGTGYEDFYVKGVNLGVGLPGTQAGDLAASREDYARWFQQMYDMGFNNIRIYTLHFPRFYEELAVFNEKHPDKPLYVFHGSWLDEVEGAADIYESTKEFQAGMKEVVDAVHGNVEIAQRRGRAYGKYTANVSRWIAGWIIGREVSPHEMFETNEKHANNTRYDGKNVAITGNPTEVWWAEQMDFLIEHERNVYKVDRPISVSSWPTLDPLIHPTENPEETEEDVVAVDFAQLEMKNMPGGFFPSFHAYPYYPNFIIYEPEYLKASDAQGINNYVGYLKDLKAHYKDMPLIIGEYGVSSSWGNAHFSPSGMHHGGLTEVQQQAGNARMTQNLRDTGTGGGMVFAWIDEWWKRTWIVDERTVPRERYRLWHNLTSPEENFGLISYDLTEPNYTLVKTSPDAVQKVEAYADPAYFRLKLTLNQPLGNQDLTIGFDTYADDLGEQILPNGVETEHRNEFALTIENGDEAKLMVTQAYDLHGIWHRTEGPKQLFKSLATKGAPWQLERWQNGQVTTSRDRSVTYPATSFDIGKVSMVKGIEASGSHDVVIAQDRTVEVRIPWVMLQFTDPSTLSVMHDNKETRERETRTTEGIALSVSFAGSLLETERHGWPTWNKVPPTSSRVKNGINILETTLKNLPD